MPENGRALTAWETHHLADYEVLVGGSTVSVAIYAPEFFSCVRNFFGQGRSGLIASSAIPVHLLQPLAAGEQHFTNSGEDGTRLQSLQYEFIAVPPNDRAEYLPVKRPFLKDLRKYCRRTDKLYWPSGYSPSVIVDLFSFLGHDD